MSKALEIIGLVKKYGPMTAVNNVSFEVSEGEIFGLLGPNGAGKTSLISTVVTVERPTEGQVKVFGVDVSKEPRRAKSITGIVPQEIVNHGFFNIEEIMVFHSGYFGIRNNKERIDYLLHRLGLYEHRKKKVKQLSGGMKRRLLIAKALVHTPKLLILDEPTAGVDIELREQLWDFVRDMRKEGVTVVLTTHYLEEAEELCDRVGIIHNGELRKIGPTSDLIKDFTQRTVTVSLEHRPQHVKSQYLTKHENKVMQFQMPASMSVGELISEAQLNVQDILDLKIEEGNLEEAFRRVLGGAE